MGAAPLLFYQQLKMVAIIAVGFAGVGASQAWRLLSTYTKEFVLLKGALSPKYSRNVEVISRYGVEKKPSNCRP